MKPIHFRNGFRKHLTSVRVGFFLAIRQIKRASFWTNVLVTFIMTLTFLNLVVVSGILVGLIEGAVQAVQEHYLGNIFISNLPRHEYIERSSDIVKFARELPSVERVTARYLETGMIETNYKASRKPTELGETVGTTFAGINFADEDAVTGLSKVVIEGEYLSQNDYDKVLLGGMLLRKYLDFESPSFPVLKNVGVGSRLRVTINGNVREVTVKGIIKSKVDEIDRRIFFTDSQLRGLIGRTDYNVDEIVLKLKPGQNPTLTKNALLGAGWGEMATVQTQEDAEPKFIKDMKETFAILGNVISSIGLTVAAITIFIVIFINAITRRKFIGILKGIGIDSLAIECAYVFQSIFYSLLGIAVGAAIVFGLLKPYLDANPINFPFSDGILVATLNGTALRGLILLAATLIAGFIPAKMITRQNTLDAILNR